MIPCAQVVCAFRVGKCIYKATYGCRCNVKASKTSLCHCMHKCTLVLSLSGCMGAWDLDILVTHARTHKSRHEHRLWRRIWPPPHDAAATCNGSSDSSPTTLSLLCSNLFCFGARINDLITVSLSSCHNAEYEHDGEFDKMITQR
jgi:hypothetical protein